MKEYKTIELEGEVLRVTKNGLLFFNYKTGENEFITIEDNINYRFNTERYIFEALDEEAKDDYRKECILNSLV